MTEREWQRRRTPEPWTFMDYTDAAVALACLLLTIAWAIAHYCGPTCIGYSLVIVCGLGMVAVVGIMVVRTRREGPPIDQDDLR